MGGSNGLGGSGYDADDAERAIRRRERAVLFVLASVQFTSIVDFMLVMPLGPAADGAARAEHDAVRR